ncbi:MAG: tRNA (adenosine(37)-N6)-threonylcarbamoyltransferase complex dimerization subunit type 1 TsaB [Sedimentisphaerales bacterium]|nr:tRNA (adenosine(37)-N6)-threonylcarbamoyltransferase complex dimerization subunit type 1 TsaB [Sedimentisphaerales bacterium]
MSDLVSTSRVETGMITSMDIDEMQNSLILAVETSGRMGSVALAEGAKLLAEKQFSGPMRHSAEIFPAIVGLLERFSKKPADIEQVYVSIGPGSFTGLRIAVTLAKSFALANQAKIVAVDTLDIIAANLNGKTQDTRHKTQDTCTVERLAVILDAKRGQFFIAVYNKTPDPKSQTQDTTWRKILPDSLMNAEELLSRFGGEKSIALIGEGLVYYKDKFAAPNVRVLDEKYWYPSSANVYKMGLELAKQGLFADPLTLTPNYLRGPDAKVKRF